MTENELNQNVAQGLYLPLMEAFYTLQGEGYHKGVPLYFFASVGVELGCLGFI